MARKLKTAAVDQRYRGINQAAIDAVTTFFDLVSRATGPYCSRTEDGFPNFWGPDAVELVNVAAAACMYLPDSMQDEVHRALSVLEVIEAIQAAGAYQDKVIPREPDAEGKPREPRIDQAFEIRNAYNIAAMGILIAVGKFERKVKQP